MNLPSNPPVLRVEDIKANGTVVKLPVNDRRRVLTTVMSSKTAIANPSEQSSDVRFGFGVGEVTSTPGFNH